MFNEPLLVVVRKPSWTLHKPLLQYALVVGFTLGDCCWFTWPGWIDSRFHGECTGRGGLTVDYIVDPVFQRGILFIFQYHSECLKLCAVMTGGSCGVSLFTPSPLFSQSWPKSSAHIIVWLVWKTTPVSPLRCWRQAHLCGEAECLLQVKHRETIKRQKSGGVSWCRRKGTTRSWNSSGTSHFRLWRLLEFWTTPCNWIHVSHASSMPFLDI